MAKKKKGFQKPKRDWLAMAQAEGYFKPKAVESKKSKKKNRLFRKRKHKNFYQFVFLE